MNDVTALLVKWRGGNEQAVDELLPLVPLVHGELRRMGQVAVTANSPSK